MTISLEAWARHHGTDQDRRAVQKLKKQADHWWDKNRTESDDVAGDSLAHAVDEVLRNSR